MHERRRRHPHWLLVLPIAAIAAGCGGDGGKGNGTGTNASVTPREPTMPTTDAKLDKELGESATTLRKAGCAWGTYPESAAEHVDDPGDVGDSHHPPTNGAHYGDWAPFGLYDEPIEDGHVVHNLEHGGVVAWLGSEVDEDQAEAIADLLDDEEKWVVAPRRDLEGLFSAAWAKGLHCPPDALDQLGPDELASALDDWYQAVVSTGSDAEKDVPAIPGSMREPSPVRDISADTAS